jgi:SAM-dependent methyltransferase
MVNDSDVKARELEYQRHEYRDTGQAAYLEPFLEPLEIDDGMSVLDVGCGSGYVNSYLARQYRLQRNIGLELELSTLQLAQQFSGDLGTIRWICASAEQLPVASASIDRLVCRGVIPLATVERVVEEFGRVLRPGGRAVMLLHSWTTYLGWVSADPRAWKRSMAGLLHFTLGAWFNLTGHQMRIRRRGHTFGQTFQSEFRMRRMLKQHGLHVSAARRSKEFLLYATKPL